MYLQDHILDWPILHKPLDTNEIETVALYISKVSSLEKG